jgi:hypothetical protein
MRLTLLLIIAVLLNTVLFKVFAVGPLLLHMLETSVELRVWNRIQKGQELFLNFRQRKKLKLQTYETKE